MSDDPPRSRARPVIVAALLAAVLVSVTATVVAVLRSDGDSAVTRDPDVEGDPGPTIGLDDLRPDGVPADGAPTPTADPSGAAAAAANIVPVELSWAASSYDDVEVLVLLHNAGEQAFANVSVEAVLLDAGGAELATIPASYARVDPGQVLPITSFTTAPLDAIADIAVDVSARGTLPPGTTELRLDGVDWHQDDLGTVGVTGTVVASERVAFVTLVAVLRDPAGEYVGSAFGFVQDVDDRGRPFEAFGFPASSVADVELYAVS